jgi:hypothetical protein
VGICQVFKNEMPGGCGVGMMRLKTAWHEACWERRRHITVEGDFLGTGQQFASRSLRKACFYNKAARQGGCRTIIGQPQPDNSRHQRRAVTDDGDVLYMLITQQAGPFQDGIQVGGADQG